MSQLMIIIGVFVFFFSVAGAVMVGGHLLGELQLTDQQPTPRPKRPEGEHPIGAAASPVGT